MKNTIHLVSVVYLSEYNPDLEIEICKMMEAYATNFNNLTVQLQDYKHDSDLQEGCLTFTLSRGLSHGERSEFRSEWETESSQVQFHTQKKLF